eukprot:Skav232102  [mRNA]  locus=scaffold2353:113252:113940:+ [translate_table: standard]
MEAGRGLRREKDHGYQQEEFRGWLQPGQGECACENDQASMVEKNDVKFYFLAIAVMMVATLMPCSTCDLLGLEPRRKEESLFWTFVVAKYHYLQCSPGIPRKQLRLVMEAIHHATVANDSSDENPADYLEAVNEQDSDKMNEVCENLRRKSGHAWRSVEFYEHYLLRRNKDYIDEESLHSYETKFFTCCRTCTTDAR